MQNFASLTKFCVFLKLNLRFVQKKQAASQEAVREKELFY